ncbi:flap endonuclease-1 [Candidatus Woesearchaeota archaeon]|nr:flap endonuclease-1 [Candidatus Woesearchaeota archaeon]MBW3006029.1 flap endonuclease-1 [Candidatus Woesearchaeota archaeon]
MGVNLKDLLVRETIGLDDLKGRIVAVDSFNMLYQFLTTIRTPDGKPLTDSKNNVTSHLIGLFNRTTKFMAKGIKPVFVFDGEKPELKTAELEKRKKLKIEAKMKYKKAVAQKDLAAMKKYGGRFAYLTKDMVDQAKDLVKALGLPVVQAPSEGEAQAAHIVSQNKAWAVVSQDFDSLVHGADRLVRNLSIAGRRKKLGAMAYTTIKPEFIDLAKNLNNLGIDQDKLIALAMLVGTDYNPAGIKGIGPKTAIKLVKEHDDFDELFEAVKWDEHNDVPWTDIFYLIKKMKVTDKYDIKFKTPDKQKIIKLLVDKHDFNVERVEKTLQPVLKEREKKQQKKLGDF